MDGLGDGRMDGSGLDKPKMDGRTNNAFLTITLSPFIGIETRLRQRKERDRGTNRQTNTHKSTHRQADNTRNTISVIDRGQRRRRLIVLSYS